jgi:hypothetical protein
MNYTYSPPGGALKPIWHPPISMEWILSFLILIAASNIEAMPPVFSQTILHPAGFFFTFLIAVYAFDAGYKVAPIAVLFYLLLAWVAKEHGKEGFQAAGTIDWVQNHSRWFSEVVLKENPKGIKDRDVATYPVQGDSSEPSR